MVLGNMEKGVVQHVMSQDSTLAGLTRVNQIALLSVYNHDRSDSSLAPQFAMNHVNKMWISHCIIMMALFS